ncbi:MAG: hypothetical protein IPP81_19950 [Chitinophagaceae bacterium]|nr:hypothetical protein [Chitinophagaceae bacterium]
MRYFIKILTLTILITSCGQTDTKQKELELKERELALKELELVLKEKDTNNLRADQVNVAPEVSYKSHTPCTFSVSLPSNFKLQAMYDDKSADYCDYSVKTKDEFEIIQLHSLLSSRFEFNSIKELYDAAINKSELDISYKTQKGNWFVISGTKKENGNTVYWKRVSGNSFISDLHIEYPKSHESEIAPYITTISNSFTSK